MSDAFGANDPAPTIAETHISTVFFAGDRAYKMLKPLRTSFLDHTTIESRLRAADQEIELNRRMAPDVYLGSADVIENGDLVDRMIVMRRLPANSRLTELIGTSELAGCLQAIARQIAVFHSKQEPIIGIEADGIAARDAIAANWANNFSDLESLVGQVVSTEDADRVQELVGRYLRHRQGLFDGRINDGFVRDGHGDLTAQDIFCLPDGPRILDCLAFDRRLRIADVLADVAFLAMDLERLIGPVESRMFLDSYCRFSNEHHPTSLAHHYIAYRASVRAKVAGIRHQQGDPEAASELRVYHDLCLRHLERADLIMILVGGPPGTGKSTLAQALSATMGVMALSTDELRKDLAGRGHLVHETEAPGEGIYTPAMNERTYRALLDRSAQLLDRGESVVLDASWNQQSQREAALAMAASRGITAIEIECVLDPEIAKCRIVRRLEAGNDPSDARPEIVDVLRDQHEPWPSATRIDTSGPPSDALAEIAARLPILTRRWATRSLPGDGALDAGNGHRD